MPTLKTPLSASASEQTTRSPPCLLELPTDVQVNLLTYLRAYDLSSVQQTCKFYNNPNLVHSIVAHTAQVVYPPRLTHGFDFASQRYTSEHLRQLELLVIARVLNSPEPPTGYIVSKSWCKTTLKWLEATTNTTNTTDDNNKSNKKKKQLSKKKQRMRQRRLSDVSPPWPNVNSDLLCEHANLQAIGGQKSARARRRVLDKQAWKILKRLYPDSTQLESTKGECLQCRAEAETLKRIQQDQLEQERSERKRPLQNKDIRHFYTRRTGVPYNNTNDDDDKNNNDDYLDTKPAARSSCRCCPLVPGRYFILPRQWCHAWRRYIKTGDGSVRAPDAASLLCEAHRLLLLPPHLEAYLYGHRPQLLLASSEAVGGDNNTTNAAAVAASPPVPRRSVPGQAMDPELMQAMQAAGLSQVEINRQLSAMQSLEQQQQQVDQQQQQQQQVATISSPHSKNELLDRENHSVVEILTQGEWNALADCWPGQHSFALSFTVADNDDITFSTPLCRDCDATGRQCEVSIKNRRVRSVKRSDKAPHKPPRSGTSLEY